MKKTLTINLGGTVYHIDEDAYILLDNYLNNLRFHFRREPGADEIIKDMESRISELFTEYINNGQQVITVENVEAVISRMGKPEELNPESEESGSSDSGEYADTSYSAEYSDRGEAKRRLFRNPDDKILGGVVSGLSAYFGWDVVWARVIFLVLGVLLHGFIIAYIIAWIIIPVANTATEKLQMKGEPINMENIGKTVTGGFEKMNEYVKSGKPRSLLQKIGDVFFAVIGFLVKVALVLAAICCAPFVFVAIVVLLALLMAATGIIASMPSFMYDMLPNIDWNVVGTSSGIAIMIFLCGVLVVGIPVAGIIQLLLQFTSGKSPMSTTAKIVLVLLWMFAAAAIVVLIFQAPFIINPFVIG